MATTLEVRVQDDEGETNGLCIQVSPKHLWVALEDSAKDSSVDAWRDFDKLWLAMAQFIEGFKPFQYYPSKVI